MNLDKMKKTHWSYISIYFKSVFYWYQS